jgi:hypothetical protein
MRFEEVFFSVCPIVLSLARSTMLSSTTLSSSSTSVYRARPLGGGEQAIVRFNQPIGLALLGNGLEDEVEFKVDGMPRMVVIEKISKAAELEFAD